MRIWIERSAGHDFPNDRRFPGVGHSFFDCTDEPAPTILAGRPVNFILEPSPDPVPMLAEVKPPYRVPLMAEISAMPWNGHTVVSTFAGCGGSSTGYRMAGFRVLMAAEFIPAAQETYLANARPGTLMEGRDIRQVTAEEILAATGLKVGELDVLDGSPPCASFSTAGKREKGWGEVKKYSDSEQRSDDLFFEFARLVRDLQPKVFVAENVSGLVKGTAKGYFLEILKALKACGYRVDAKLLDAQWLGVPQARQRLIFVGVRNDLAMDPVHPKPLPYRYSIREALPWISSVVHDTSGQWSTGDVTDRPSPTVTVGVNSVNSNHFKVAGDEPRLIQGPEGDFSNAGKPVSLDAPSPTILAGDPSKREPRQFFLENAAEAPELHVVGNSNSPHTRKGERKSVDEPAPTVLARRVNLELEKSATEAPYLPPSIGQRIMPKDVVPDNVGASLDGYAIGSEWEKVGHGGQSEKYFQLVRPDADKPSPTVTASGGGGSGGAGVAGSIAGVTHPTEKRKFSIAELRRICGFPDDFILLGTYAQQWERLGRAVPPVMMSHVAATIRDEILAKVPR